MVGTDIRKVFEINPDAAVGSSPEELTAYQGRLYFEATDGSSYQLWEYDGSDSPSLGTSIRKIEINASGSAYPGSFHVFNDRLYFHADDGTNGRQLWTLYIK